MNEIVIHEKNIPDLKKSIPIKISYIENNENNYDIKTPFFDPNNQSPPNYFINKLLIRIQKYEVYRNDFILSNK
jgi:hypothetical protein